jgi:uncharacterized LabA/DUF88 family protein
LIGGASASRGLPRAALGRFTVRVALFFDGKNHMKDLKQVAGERWMDHGALAARVVERVGGTELVAAHYYTAVPSPGEDSGRSALYFLLGELERIPGFFVHRFPRHTQTWPCSRCGHEETFSREKMVDTQLVADVVAQAARGLWDIAVVFSGDMDVAPALSGARSFGRRAWVATFGRHATSRELMREAWGTLDLRELMDGVMSAAPVQVDVGPVDLQPGDDVVLRELARGQQHFESGGGFLGAQFFLHRWKGIGLSDDHEERRRAVERLVRAGLVEIVGQAGRTALRVVEPGAEPSLGDADVDDSVLHEE